MTHEMSAPAVRFWTAVLLFAACPARAVMGVAPLRTADGAQGRPAAAVGLPPAAQPTDANMAAPAPKASPAAASQPASPADVVEQALGPQGQAPANTPVAAAASSGPEPAPAPAPKSQSATTTAPAPPAQTTAAAGRSQTSPWDGMQNTGPAPQDPNPSPCAMPGDPWGAGAPVCPPGYTPGTHARDCGAFATLVDLAGSVICVSDGVGLDQFDGSITAQDRSDASAFLQKRGLAASAAQYAVNQLNAPNLQSFTCGRHLFVNTHPMDIYPVVWNVMLYSYLYGQIKMQEIEDPYPALCSKSFKDS